MPNKFPRGSEWRKWDLHIHPVGTKMANGYKAEDLDSFCDIIERSDVSAFGITDYFSADTFYTFKKAFFKKYPKSEKVFFLNIELRLDISVSKSQKEVNLHILFDPIIPEATISKFLTKLEITETKGGAKVSCNEIKNYLSASVTLESIQDTLKDVFGNDKKYIIVASSKDDGIRADNKSPRKMTLSDEVDKICDGVFGNEDQETRSWFLGIDRYENKTEKSKPIPVFAGSDAHSIKDLQDWLGKTFKDTNFSKHITWIKADLTFEGLKQVLIEPEQRVYIGNLPDKKAEEVNSPQNYIDKLIIQSNKKAEEKTEWFDNITNIELNSGLVSIIGNKGSGKSAIADIIASAGNCYSENFSFLDPSKFLALGRISGRYTSGLTFKDSYTTNSKSLFNPKGDRNNIERVKYLSQNFVADLCEKNDYIKLQNEVNSVIFSHIPMEYKQGQGTLQELLNIKKEPLNKTYDTICQEIFYLCEKIVETEKKLKPTYKEAVTNKLTEIRRIKDETSEILKKLPVIEKPTENTEIIKQISEISFSIVQNEEKIKKTKSNIAALESFKNQLLTISSEINSIKSDLDLLHNKFISFPEGINKFELKSIVSLKYDPTPLNDAKNKAQEKINILTKEQEKTTQDNIAKSIKLKDSQLNITKENSKWMENNNERVRLENKIKELTGDSDTDGTEIFLGDELLRIGVDYPAALKKIYEELKEKQKRLLQNLINRKDLYSDIYKYAQKIAEEQGNKFNILTSDFITFDSEINFASDFNNKFFAFINLRKRGTFSGKDEAVQELNKLKKGINLGETDSILSFPYKILEVLKHNISLDPQGTNPGYNMDIDEQLLNVNEKAKLYYFLFTFRYLDPHFKITYDGKDISILSPGERGILLLVFYMLISKEKTPIVIDQPEENLDNETVFIKLVPFIKETKKHRQIIIVTHNPNIAIACDAEQLIYAHIDKKDNNLITYQSGSIENREMKQHALDILEGTARAFNNRKYKYASNLKE